MNSDLVVQFNFTEWITAYPEFGGISANTAQEMFFRTTLFIDNTPVSPIEVLTQRKWILYMGTAHMAALFAPRPSVVVNPNQPPGRVSSATEGTVTVQFDYLEATSDIQAFWSQTKYGAALLAATLQFRLGFYVPGPPQLNPIQNVFGNWPLRGR